MVLSLSSKGRLQVKQGVVGYGKAEKRQVMEMTKNILGLPEVPKPDDTADALAMAICHAHIGASGLGSMSYASGKSAYGRQGNELNAGEVVDGLIKFGKKVFKERNGI